MQKVLYVIDSLQTGGAEKSTLDIASRLHGTEPIVCHIYKNDFLRKEFEERGVRVISLNIDGPYNFLRAYRAFRNVLQQEKPALVIGTLLRAELISRLACKSLRIPNVGTFVNDTYSKFEWQSLSLPMKSKISFFWILNVFTARYCVGFLSNSESIKKSNCRALFIPRKKVRVIYRGRRPDLFPFSSARFKEQKIKFLSIGRLLYRKGHEELITAFYKFQKLNPNSNLTIAGEGPFRTRLEQLIKQLDLGDKVVLLGNIRDTASQMKAHDVFVFPSHYEGFSGTIVEAMLSGIPILASDIDMNREAIIHNETGRLFKVKDVDAIVNEMVWACNHAEQVMLMSAKARKVAEERFDIDTIVRQHENYYIEVLTKCATA